MLELYATAVQRFLKDVHAYAQQQAASYRRQQRQKAPLMAPASSSLKPGSFAMVLRPHLRKVHVATTGPYVVTEVRKHSFILRNLLTG